MWSVIWITGLHLYQVEGTDSLDGWMDPDGMKPFVMGPCVPSCPLSITAHRTHYSESDPTLPYCAAEAAEVR